MFKNRKFLAYALVIVSTLVATFAFYFWQVAKSPNLNVDGKKTFVLYIPKGATYQTVLDSLDKHKIINDKVAFGFLSKWMKYPERVKYGRYEIPANSGNREILQKLRLGEQDPVKLTFNNVRLKDDLIRKIGDKMNFSSDELRRMLDDTAATAKYNLTPENIMVMFLPNTYHINWTITPEQFMDRMHDEYKKYWTDERLAKAKSINLTPVQVGVLASIVQSETRKVDEMPRVAGAYINRLNQGMKLDADPTVKFAWGDFSLRRILNKHLAIDSPYNTYRYTGLPPGPIALPEPDALSSVLNYENHDYVYFCAKEDFSGYHNFATNYTDHMANARRYQEALNQRNIMK